MKSSKIAIITDSTCDIPQTLVEQYGIKIIPQFIIWGDQQYRDRVEMTPEQFYSRLVTDPIHPTSSQASAADFQNLYDQVTHEGAEEIVVLTVSSAMSGTYQSAMNAAKSVSVPVTVIDSKGPTMTLGWQVLAAARAREIGADVKIILETIEQVKNRLVQFVCMDTIEYLQKGGRIGNAVKWVGSLLQVKPLVRINHQTGVVEPVTLGRTHKSLVETMYSKFFSSLDGRKNMRIAVLHGNALEEAETLAERIRVEFHPIELIVHMTGPVLGINTGPGALALCGYTET